MPPIDELMLSARERVSSEPAIGAASIGGSVLPPRDRKAVATPTGDRHRGMSLMCLLHPRLNDLGDKKVLQLKPTIE